MKKPSLLRAPSYLPINHLLTPHSHRSPPPGPKVCDPVKIPLFLLSPSLLSFIVSLSAATVYLPEPLTSTPFFTISVSVTFLIFASLCSVYTFLSLFVFLISAISFYALSSTPRLLCYSLFSPTPPPTFCSSCCFKWSV